MLRQRGQLLVELLVALGVSAIMIPALTAGFVASRQGKAQQEQRLEAVMLAQEATEAVYQVRQAGWSFVAGITGTVHPEISGSSWILAPDAETMGGYTRQIVFADVTRDSAGAIAAVGVRDPSTKHITVTVSWGTPIASSVTSSFYITRMENNQWTQTTQADFDAGVATNVITINILGGEVTLGAGGRADWCSPNLTIAAVDLPKSGVANAVSAIEGNVFAGTGDNASGVSYATVTFDNNNPPQATVSGTFDGFKTNGIFGETGFSYLATDNNFKEIEIIDLGTSPYVEAGYFDAPGNGNGNSIFVSGSVGYMTSGSQFYTFDLTSKSGSRPVLGTTTIAGTGVKIQVIGGYAYVAINSVPTQLQILDVSNPASPVIVGNAQVGGLGGKDIFVDPTGSRAYLATALSSSEPELFILDVTNKIGDHTIPIGSYEANGMDPKGITVVPGNRAILVGTGGEEYQAINISDETSPTHCGGLHIDSGVNGVSSVLEADGDAYSYIITGDASTELKIIEGGPGGKFANNGIFESSILDASTSAVFNRFVSSAIIPANTTVQYQVAGADPVGGSCASAEYIYVGPDATSATKFSTSSAIPFSEGPGYKNPAQCFRYKVYLSSQDPLFAPIFTDMTINYSP
ncbi:hypothetical protein A2363_01870 [Candidatus Gottesmanbacteria bacterium RIFOXYB1_FULL_47_11]|uniref:Uncharacterized protein n=1 Tax=Candidatus Gottesmanbacteria bacterium RIFOXYB1_FULL_47_11 TaxID=1798401 RepID=A0A1F6BDC4_9BACT|nr:MAG: hypothetical protein A2363_01870 [Candidatus Gottesmanbacteria bacterium RIFOXYB1_FULL_47_11]